MKRLLFILALLSSRALAQQGNTISFTGSGAPTGTCAYIFIYTDIATGNFYNCKNGAWNLVTGGGGGGVTSLTGDGSLVTNSGSTGAVTLTLSSSGQTGVAQVSSGTWSFSAALASTTTATTQSATDNSTKVATTAYADKLITNGFINFFNGNTNSAALPQNVTRCWKYTSPSSITTTKVAYNLGVADNTGNHYDIGFYSASGTLLGHLGATVGTTFSPSTGVKTLSWLSSFNLFANVAYFFCETTDAASAPAQITGQTNIILPNANTAPSSGNATSGGVLNNSITPAADSNPSAFAIAPGLMLF